MKLYQIIAQLVDAEKRCAAQGNSEWGAKHRARLSLLCENHLPHGSGFDNGVTLDLDESTGAKLVFTTSFHHMNEGGVYDGWTEHTVTVRPSLALGFYLTVSGKDRNQIKEYIGDQFHADLDFDVGTL